MPISTKGKRYNWVSVAFKNISLMALLYVPQANGTIISTRGQGSSIRGPGKALKTSLVAGECMKQGSCLHIPQTNDRIARARSQSILIRGPYNTPDRNNLSGK